jgi:hypothetical protein
MDENIAPILKNFIRQAHSGELKTSIYPKEWGDFKMKTSFGMGAPARVPWIAFTAPEMQVSNGFYPVYLYYKDKGILILAYGISETHESTETWPAEVMNSSETISAFFDAPVPRYGTSFIFRSYTIKVSDDVVFGFTEHAPNMQISDQDLDADLRTILEYYAKAVAKKVEDKSSPTQQGLFYIEKQLEDFLILNWASTELGQRFDLIVEEGELVSQQYRTDIGPIDILVRDKHDGAYVVIELKRNQTSDDTVGQIARYMGWVKKEMGAQDVRGVIVAGAYDRRLEYALATVPGVEVFLYEVDFKLKPFSEE